MQERRLARPRRAGDGVQQPAAELGVEPVEHDGLAVALLAARAPRPRRASRCRPAAVPGTAAPGTGRSTARARRRLDDDRAVLEARGRRACRCRRGAAAPPGRRSQPPRPTTIVSLAAPSRAHSSETRPSRMRTIRSAMRVDSGSWLTITVVQPCSRTSSAERRVDLVGGGGVELAGRLVGEEHARPVGERGAQRDALLLAAGELRGPPVALRREADPLEQLVGPAQALRAVALPRRPELQRDELACASAPARARARSAGRRSRAATSGTARAGARAACRRPRRRRARRPPRAARGRRGSAAASTCPSRSARARSAPRRRPTRSDSPCSAAASPSGVEWTRKTSRSSIAASCRHLGRARRCAAAQCASPRATSSAASSDVGDGRGGEQRQVEREPERRLRLGGAGRHRDERDHERREDRRRARSRRRSRRRRRAARAGAGGRGSSPARRPAPRGRTARRARRARRRRRASSRPTSASSSATAAVPASVSSAPRASGSACSVRERRRRDVTVSA